MKTQVKKMPKNIVDIPLDSGLRTPIDNKYWPVT